MTKLFNELPMWLSFAFTLLGIVVSVRLAWLAYKGVLFAFTITLTVGIVLFGFHHLVELADPDMMRLAVALEAVSSAVFLGAAIFMGYRLRKILSDR